MRLAEKFLEVERELGGIFVERSEAIRCITLALVTGGNFLLVGDPGTGKSALIDCYLRHFNGVRKFEALCGSFTTLDEIVGPVDLASFQAGTWARSTNGMLPDSNVAFLDEVMKSNDGTINSLLQLLNERKFAGVKTDLWSVGAATNWPEIKSRSEKVSALYDRFVLRHHVVAVENHAAMLLASSRVQEYRPTPNLSLDDMRAAKSQISTIKISEQLLGCYVNQFVMRLREAGVDYSDRRSSKALDVLRASAWLRGAVSVSVEDFSALAMVAWNDDNEITVARAIAESVDQAVLASICKRIDSALASLRNDKLRVVDTIDVLSEAKRIGRFVQESAELLTDRSRELLRPILAELGGAYHKQQERLGDIFPK